MEFVSGLDRKVECKEEKKRDGSGCSIVFVPPRLFPSVATATRSGGESFGGRTPEPPVAVCSPPNDYNLT